MVEIFSFELAKARQRVQKVDASLVRANGERSSVAVNLDRIRSEEQSVADAKQRLTKIDHNVEC